MNREYPDFATYRLLYQRFYDGRSSDELLGLAGNVSGKRILDCCGGDGRLTQSAIRLGAREIVIIDEEEKMIPPEIRNTSRVSVYISDVLEGLHKLGRQGETFDCVACQQAVNYWLDPLSAKLVSLVLSTQGSFVFNTFNRKPSEKPMVKEYELDGHSFVEVSWSVGDTVNHIQIRSGMDPHFTSFRWFSPDALSEILTPYFTVIVKEDGPTSLYLCRKK